MYDSTTQQVYANWPLERHVNLQLLFYICHKITCTKLFLHMQRGHSKEANSFQAESEGFW
jgi:hypothetical protein